MEKNINNENITNSLKELEFIKEIEKIEPPIEFDLNNDFNKIEQNDLEELEKKLKNETDLIKSNCINVKGEIDKIKQNIEQIRLKLESEGANLNIK